MDAHVYLHASDASLLTDLQTQLRALAAQVTTMNADLQAAFDVVDGKLTTFGTLITSTKTELEGLSAEIASLKASLPAATTDPAVLARLTAMGTKVDTMMGVLSAADVANQPS